MSKIRHLIRLAAFSAAFAFATVACGDNDDNDGPADASLDASAAKSGGNKTSQGGSGASGAAGAGGATVPPCIKSTTCGEETCSTADIGDSVLSSFVRYLESAAVCVAACCTADNKCGSTSKITQYTPGTGIYILNELNCTERDQPGTESEGCPRFFEAFQAEIEDAGSVNLDYLEELNFIGCCRFDGICGYLVSMFGLGCVSEDETRAMFGFAGLTNATAKPCTPSSNSR